MKASFAALLFVNFAVAAEYAEIRVIDSATGRGVPLVELETVNSLKFVTDNAGRVAFNEPGLLDRELCFSVRSHGYEIKKDGFGIAGVRITPKFGDVSKIKITRKNIAERLCRLTGEGRWRDSTLLGHTVPPENNGLVAGQDSVQTAIYRGKVYWLWGDTQQMKYPLGLFRTAGATTPLLDAQYDLANGLPFEYFTDPKTKFARAMMPLTERQEGVVWLTSLCVVPDEKGVEKMVCHYTRRKGLGGELEHGIALFNDDKAIFEPLKQLPLEETWRHPTGHPIAYEEAGTKWLLFGSPTPNVRVPATLASILDPSHYEAFTFDGLWHWQKKKTPTDSKAEQKLKQAQSRFYPTDVNSSERILLHNGTVRWNEYRKRWIMIAGQVFGKSSNLGEVWYAEAKEPTGPFINAVRIVTHEKYSFYNVCHHAFLNRDGGRTIHFEGTYTEEFSGNPIKTPRYNYNQILYRLDLSSPALTKARVN